MGCQSWCPSARAPRRPPSPRVPTACGGPPKDTGTTAQTPGGPPSLTLFQWWGIAPPVQPIALPPPLPHTVSPAGPDSVSQTVSPAAPLTLSPQTVSHCVSDCLPHCVSDCLPHCVPDSVPHQCQSVICCCSVQTGGEVFNCIQFQRAESFRAQMSESSHSMVPGRHDVWHP